MGVVVAAMHLQLEERVAIKFLLPAALREASVVSRFAREGRAAVKIKSEHVVRVMDVGSLDDGAPYIVMEHLTGNDFARTLTERGPVPTPEAVGWIMQALEAIAEAHSLGIVHRDLKPANLFLAQTRHGMPSVKVLDFGISKAAGAGDVSAALTQTTTVVGSPLYMSPEQWLSARDVDASTDIWSVGAVLFEMLTGRPPFGGESLAQLCAAVLNTPPLSLRSLVPHAPEGLEQVLNQCLQKQRDARFRNTLELARSLAPYAGPNAGLSLDRIAKLVGGSSVSEPGSTLMIQPSDPRPSSGPTGPFAARPSPAAYPAAMPLGTGPQPVPMAPSITGPRPIPAMSPQAMTNGSLVATIPGARKTRPLVAIGAVVVGIVLVATLGIGSRLLPMIQSRRAAAGPTTSASAPAASTSAPIPPASTIATASPDPPPEASARGDAEPMASASATAAPPPLPAPPRRLSPNGNGPSGAPLPVPSYASAKPAASSSAAPPQPSSKPPPKRSDLGGRL
jgi:serine/threonine-protein kinase